MQAGECAGAILVGWQEGQTVFNLLLLCWDWGQAGLCALFNSSFTFLQPSPVNPTSFQLSQRISSF